jgi:hypothetical protein
VSRRFLNLTHDPSVWNLFLLDEYRSDIAGVSKRTFINEPGKRQLFYLTYGLSGRWYAFRQVREELFTYHQFSTFMRSKVKHEEENRILELLIDPMSVRIKEGNSNDECKAALEEADPILAERSEGEEVYQRLMDDFYSEIEQREFDEVTYSNINNPLVIAMILAKKLSIEEAATLNNIAISALERVEIRHFFYLGLLTLDNLKESNYWANNLGIYNLIGLKLLTGSQANSLSFEFFSHLGLSRIRAFIAIGYLDVMEATRLDKGTIFILHNPIIQYLVIKNEITIQKINDFITGSLSDEEIHNIKRFIFDRSLSICQITGITSDFILNYFIPQLPKAFVNEKTKTYVDMHDGSINGFKSLAVRAFLTAKMITLIETCLLSDLSIETLEDPTVQQCVFSKKITVQEAIALTKEGRETLIANHQQTLAPSPLAKATLKVQ